MSASEIVLIAAAILVPLALAIAVTLWTLQPAVRRAERAKRSRRRTTPPNPTSQTPPNTSDAEDSTSEPG